MLDNVIIDVAIGLIFIYCLYSLFVTIINEIIASAFSLRGQMLRYAIKRMLKDENENLVKRVFNWIINKRGNKKSPLGKTLFKNFYDHPLIKYMSDGILFKKPSYISSENFAKVLIDTLEEYSTPESGTSIQVISKTINTLGKADDKSEWQSDTLKLINSFLKDAGDDLGKFKAKLETWFNDTMDRASGWYKRQTQLIILVTGFLVAISFNVNTFEIVSRLSKDKIARDQIVQISENYLKDRIVSESDTNTIKRLDSLVTSASNLYKTDVEPVNNIIGLGWGSWSKFKDGIWNSLLGCLITSLAISLGAPFWFDILNKIVKIRGTGSKPPADKEKS